MHRMFITCVVIVLTTVESKVAQTFHDDDDDLQRWSTFIQNMIDRFYHQREVGTAQFGFILLGNPQQNILEIELLPHDIHGNPVVDNRQPLSPNNPNDYVNYVAARPDYVPEIEDAIHAEDLILGVLNRLWNNYLNRFQQTPTVMLLYSWIMPCQNCAQLILNYFTAQPYVNVPQRIVVHTTEGYYLPYMTPEGNQETRNRLWNAGIHLLTHRCFSLPPSLLLQSEITNKSGFEFVDVMRQIYIKDYVFDQCVESETLQGCLYNCLKNSICCCCEANVAIKMSADFVNVFIASCGNSDLETCAKTWLDRQIGIACECQQPLLSKLNQCTKKCKSLPMVKPLNPSNPTLFTGILRNMNDLQNYIPPLAVCKDGRQQGLLCSWYDPRYFTAGNSPCRLDHPCGYHGKSYSWCNTDVQNNWDYCCTGACQTSAENYLWCKSGSTWQYCGGGGMINVKGTRCLPDHPCGLHLDVKSVSYYWCYIDFNLNWEYCCNSQYPCNYHSESYKWCRTNYVITSNTNWQRCTLNSYKQNFTNTTLSKMLFVKANFTRPEDEQ